MFTYKVLLSASVDRNDTFRFAIHLPYIMFSLQYYKPFHLVHVYG